MAFSLVCKKKKNFKFVIVNVYRLTVNGSTIDSIDIIKASVENLSLYERIRMHATSVRERQTEQRFSRTPIIERDLFRVKSISENTILFVFSFKSNFVEQVRTNVSIIFIST